MVITFLAFNGQLKYPAGNTAPELFFFLIDQCCKLSMQLQALRQCATLAHTEGRLQESAGRLSLHTCITSHRGGLFHLYRNGSLQGWEEGRLALFKMSPCSLLERSANRRYTASCCRLYSKPWDCSLQLKFCWHQKTYPMLKNHHKSIYAQK